MILSAMLFALSWQGPPQFIAIFGQNQAQSNKPAIPALRPGDFRELPPAIVKSLEARKCLIPQWSYEKTSHNVIQGSFTGANRNEWAALCSRGGTSSILVFRAQSAGLVAEIAAEKDDKYLHRDEKGRLIYSRIISTVDKDYILEHYEAYGGPEPPPITHQGINDAFAEKASIVRYFYRSKWIELQGAD